MFPVHPLFAVGEVEIIFAIIVGIISFISWIAKAIKGKQQGEARVAGQQDDSIRNEIESFLQDVLGQKPPGKQADEGDFLEIVEEEPPRRKKRGKQLQRKRKPRQQSEQPTNIENRSVGQSSKSFGSDLREHVSEHMQSQHFDKSMGHNVDQSVSQHLGAFSGGGDDVELISASDELRSEVLKMLRNPEGVRKAMMLNLILTPPASLKKN